MAADPLAALDDHAISRRLAASAPTTTACSLQGDAADNPDQRMTDDVKLFVDRTLNIGVGLLSSIVTLASFVVDPVGPFERGAAASVRQRIYNSRLSGLGRADLCGVRHHPDALIGWPLVGSISTSSATRRISASTWCACAKIPSRSRCCSGEHAERERLLGPLRPRGRQLVRHHEPHQAADGLHRELCTGGGGVSLRPGRARLFRQQDPARRR